MKIRILFLAFSVLFHAIVIGQFDLQQIAPLIPLEPQFPLELTQANRELFIDNPKQLEQAKNFIQNYLESHSFPWLSLVSLLGLGGIGWTAYLTRDRWPKFAIKPAIVIPPKQQTDQKLQALQKRPFDQAYAKEYFAELASILLASLQIRLGIKTQELTTVELGNILNKQSNLSSHEISEALSLLREIDHVKFAGKIPSSNEAIQMFQHTQNFINSILKNQ